MDVQIGAMNLMRVSTTLLLGLCLCLFAAPAQSQSPAGAAYTDVFYPSGSLRIHAFLYKPEGDGPFPVVIYNHGARTGRPRSAEPNEYIGRLLARAGYAVLIPERRGYGDSQGPTLAAAIRNDMGQRFVARVEAETDDVLAAVEYLRTLPFADSKRIGIMGFSLGGIVTMFAISRSNPFTVAVNQAGAAGAWDISAPLRSALIAAAEKATTPTLFMVAQNDRSTESITTLGEIFKKRGVPHRVIVYEPFTPQQVSWPGEFNTAPGHEVFRAQGVHVWEKDVVEFLARYLGSASTGAAKAQQ
jgi:dienelactone hydrolase